ncbi:zf-CCCH domain-containing protein [Cephalotus follicularis]|uniref:Zf-CCCH domain-containing protein n=1 Tax=Cephalotus follicularis TaxID=3775 RepID=A0A1Q3DDD5_CEPFO|nr:zf-CCCH domain-containing protein [Cephalotus follicularis]
MEQQQSEGESITVPNPDTETLKPDLDLPPPPPSDIDLLVDELQNFELKNTEETVEKENDVDHFNDVERSENDDEEEEKNVNGDAHFVYESEKLGGGVFGDGDGENSEERRRYLHPVRPEAEDCAFYMKTGSCKFGSNCKFNHPVRRKNQVAGEKVKERDESVEKSGRAECKYYLRTGGCKFGKACRYNHSRAKTGVDPVFELNFLGLPIRPGEKECPYYMRNGSCKYASNCRFNHPDPTAVGFGDSLSGYGNGGSVSSQAASQSSIASWSSPRALNETAPYVPVMYSPPQRVNSHNSEWDGYQAPVYPPPERSMHPPSAYVMNNPVTDMSMYSQHHPQMLVDEFPERPGQPECSYYLKTGDCKFKSNCKYHHPRIRFPRSTPCALSDKGLPLRPDQNICSHYSRYGICKFGPACKFDHPIQPAMPGDQSTPFGNSAGSGNGSDAPIQQHA